MAVPEPNNVDGRRPGGSGGGDDSAPAAPVSSPPPREARTFLWRVVMATGTVGLGLAIVLTLWFQIRVLLLGLAGLLVAVLLYRLSALLSRWLHLPYWVSLIVVCVVLLGGVAGIVALTGTRIAQQMQSLSEQLPEAWQHVRANLSQQAWGRWVLQQGQVAWAALTGGGNGLSGASRDVGRGIGNVLASTTLILGELLVVLFVGLFGAINPELYVRGVMRMVPPANRSQARRVMTEMGQVLWWWLIGQFVAMAFIGLVTGLSVWLLGVPLALTLGVIAAIFNFIPNFGPIVAVVPAALLALLKSPMTAIWIILVYTAIQLLQNHVVTPVTQQKAVRLPAVLLMLAQVFMYYWAGLLGMALAPVLAAMVLRAVQMLYVNGVLHDPMVDSDGFWPRPPTHYRKQPARRSG